MWPYWLMFLLPTLVAMNVRKIKASTSTGFSSEVVNWEWVSVSLVMTLLIGYRFEVGGDWSNYLPMLDIISGLGLIDVLKESDPSYQLINWVSVEMHWGIFGVNLIGGGIFSIGLSVFCLNQPRPWLALAVALPYMVIVVAMGYSRQGVALGLVML